MSKIFCVIGKSGTGKDTILNELVRLAPLKPVIGYTTRPPRHNEINGIAYHFISEKQLEDYKEQRKVIEERTYNTVNGLWRYATIDDGQFQSDKDLIMISTLEVYGRLIYRFGFFNVIPIYLDLDDEVRKERLISRESQEENPNFKELERRFNADNVDFSDDKLINVGIDTRYKNKDLAMCLEQILEGIEYYNEMYNKIKDM